MSIMRNDERRLLAKIWSDREPEREPEPERVYPSSGVRIIPDMPSAATLVFLREHEKEQAASREHYACPDPVMSDEVVRIPVAREPEYTRGDMIFVHAAKCDKVMRPKVARARIRAGRIKQRFSIDSKRG